MYKDAITSCSGILMAGFSLLVGGWDHMTQCLFILIAVDIVIGIVDAIVFHATKYGSGFSSNGLLQGAVRKGLMLIVVVVATQADKILNVDYLRTVSVAYLCATECVSILENLAKSGVPFPKKLKTMLVATKEEIDSGKT